MDRLPTFSKNASNIFAFLSRSRKDRAGAFHNASATVAEQKEQLAAVQAKLSWLLNAMIEGVVSREEYTTAKQPLIADKTSLDTDLVELVKFPEPWGLWAKMRKSSGWWSYYHVARTYFVEKMTKKAASYQHRT